MLNTLSYLISRRFGSWHSWQVCCTNGSFLIFLFLNFLFLMHTYQNTQLKIVRYWSNFIYELLPLMELLSWSFTFKLLRIDCQEGVDPRMDGLCLVGVFLFFGLDFMLLRLIQNKNFLSRNRGFALWPTIISFHTKPRWSVLISLMLSMIFDSEFL